MLKKYKHSKCPFLVIIFLLFSELMFINLFENLYRKIKSIFFQRKKIFFIIVFCYEFINLFNNLYRKTKSIFFFLQRKNVFSRYSSLLYFAMDGRKVLNELVEYYGKIVHITKANRSHSK